MMYLEIKDINWIITNKKYQSIKNLIKNNLNVHHINNPDKKGFIKEEINLKLNYNLNFLDKILNSLCKEKIIKVENDLYSLFSFSINHFLL